MTMQPSKTFYTRFAGSYSGYAAQKESYIHSVDNFIRDEAGFSSGAVIDVGAGDGKRGKRLANSLGASEIVFVDNSEGMVQILKDIPGASVVSADISQIHFSHESTYETVLCLWNVLGHVPYQGRATALKNLSSLVGENGHIFLNVNNRYNKAQYGIRSVMKNIFKDIFVRSRSNGDFPLKVMTDEGEFSTNVHIFSPFEVERMIKKAGLKIVKRKCIDYRTGEYRNALWKGQLVYKLKKQ